MADTGRSSPPADVVPPDADPVLPGADGAAPGGTTYGRAGSTGDVVADAAVRDLVERARSGDLEAFGGLYDRYVGLVYRYVYYRVASQQIAEDLTAETFLRALRRISTFTWQGRDIGAWFVTIARNLIADHYKSSRYRLEVVTADVSLAGSPPAVPGPEGEVLAGLRDQTLLDAVRRLGPEQQECIVLRFVQGLSVAETARIMDKNDAAIKALQYRAVKALGRLLEGVEL